MKIWIFVLNCFNFLHIIINIDIHTKDFQLFSKEVCRFGCSTIICYANTVISVDSVKQITDSKCNEPNPTYTLYKYSCHLKYVENHIYKTCSNSVHCNVCLNKIESDFLPNSLCSSEFDFILKYRCIPAYTKNENVCADSYLDIDCFDRNNEKLVILNATLYPEIKSTSEDPIGCKMDKSPKKRIRCPQIDKTNQAISQCSFRDKCSIGPHTFTPPNCGNMHMKLSHACVPKQALYYNNVQMPKKGTKIIKMKSKEDEEESNSWFQNNKWMILGISVTAIVMTSLIISVLICLNRKNHRQRSCDIAPKDNLFSKLGQAKFSPPPSSIDKVNIEFENGTLAPPDIYNCHSDNEESHVRSIYSTNIPNTLSYSSQFCNGPPLINTCQYFAPLLSPSHINMLEMPAIQLASSGNLTSSTMNSSHGTPRGTKSSGIFSMTDMSFENTHLV